MQQSLRSVGLQSHRSRAVTMSRLLYLLLLIPATYAVPSNIVRPCYVDDYGCMGRNLAANSVCNQQVVGIMPANYTIDQFFFKNGFFNSSYIDYKLTISNHNKCYVSEFFYNLATDTLVIAIRCPYLKFQSTRLLIQHKVEREDETYSYNYSGTYPEVIVTVNLRPANAIDLCKAESFAYVTALPEFDIDPNDEPTSQFLSTDLSFLNIFERETFAYRGDELIRYFINSMLCNFGCDF